ncbi:MAG: succinate dehydrogenase cytochrome b subunit [bacterium]
MASASDAIVDTKLERTYGFYAIPIGKKAVMAFTGLILVFYVIGHLAGNLLIYGGRATINSYSEMLHASSAALWTARVVLLLAVGLHIWMTFSLWREKRRARPVQYHKKDFIVASYASRTMMWSGPIFAAFVVFHVMHLTVGDVPGLALARTDGGYDVYQNLVVGFRHWWVSAAYIVAVLLLMLHLYHGVWSMFQSVGLNHPRFTPRLKRFAQVFSIAIAAGYISIPLAVLTGVIGGEVR